MVKSHVCHFCKQRTLGCHSTCELYINECKEREKDKAEMYSKKNKQRDLNRREDEVKFRIKKKRMGK